MSGIIQWRQSVFGHLDITPVTAGEIDWRHEAPSTHVKLMEWRLPPKMVLGAPFTSALHMVGVEDADGNLRIAPRYGAENLISNGFACGLAILEHHQRLSARKLFSYRAYWLAFCWLKERGLKLRRKFASTSEFIIKRSGRTETDQRYILPADLGLNASGDGRPWSLDDFLEQGHQAARAAGVQDPDSSETIAHGLMAAALLNPMHLRANEVQPLVRLALYATPRERSPNDAIREEVIARLSQAWEEHQFDPQAKFSEWCWGSHSNLPKSLANRRTKTSGEISVADVKAVLQDLGWEAYQAISHCLFVSCGWLKNCLIDDFTTYASALFEQFYSPQAVFGNLPLVLISDRMPIIKPILQRLWETPDDPDLIGAFHRVLDYYRQMVESRRAADRHSKTVMVGIKRQATPTNQTARVASFVDKAMTAAATAAVEQLAQRVADRDHVRCTRCGGPLRFQVDDSNIVNEETMECVGACPNHPEQQRRVEIATVDVLAAVADFIPPPRAEPSHQHNRRQRPK